MNDKSRASSPSLETLKAGFLLICVCLLYYPTTKADFIWDDDVFITQNPIMATSNALERFWFSTDPPDYFPLVSTNLWLQRHLWGVNPLGNHLVNIAFHAFNALLFWRVLLRMAVPGAWMAAMVFALHPIQVESVSWATQIKTVQSTFFYLLALLTYLQFCVKQNLKVYGLSLFLFVLALLSKTSVVMLPVVLLLYHVWKQDIPLLATIRRTFPYFSLSLIFGLITIWYQYNSAGAKGNEWSLSFGERLVNAGHNIFFYLYKLVVPLDLTFVYPRWSLDVSQWISWTPHMALGFILYFFYRNRNRWGRHAFFGLGYFIVSLFPVLGFLNIYFMLFSFVADHYQYIAGQGIIALSAAATYHRVSKITPTFQKMSVVLTFLILVTLAILTWKQQAHYQNSVVLWQDTLKKNPNAWIAHNNLGLTLADKRNFDEAIFHYREAIKIKPNYANGFNNLGIALREKGKHSEAISHFRSAIKFNPDFALAHYNLGTVLKGKEQLDEVISHYKTAVKLRPDLAIAHNNLGAALYSKAAINEAIVHYKEALRLRPNYYEAHNNLGNALKNSGQLDKAINQYRTAIKIKPDYAIAHNSLGNALSEGGKLNEAIIHYKAAIKIKPDYASAYSNLGNALYAKRDLDEAETQFKFALRIKPDFAKAHNSLGAVLFDKRQIDKAIVHFKSALKVQPYYAEAYNNLGNALRQRGQLKEAIDNYRIALKIKPNFAVAHHNLENSLKIIKNLGRVR